jgi:RNA polymerase sigma-70 factor (ECF subfamily)
LWRVPRHRRDDVVQETLRVAVESLPRFDPERASLATWLYTIAVRTARDARERDEHHEPTFALDDDAPSTDRGPEERVILEDGRRLIRKTLDEMKPELREVLEAFEVAELTMEEIAELLGVSARAAKHKLELARKDFRRRIADKRSKDRMAGLLTLTLGVDSLFAAARGRMAGSSMRSSAASALPSPGLPVSTALAQSLGKMLTTFLTGGAVGGVIVYLLMRQAPGVLSASLEPGELTDRAASIAAGLARAPEVQAPAPVPPPAETAQIPGTRRPLREARARLEEALRAARGHDLPRAHGALARYERDYPDNPLPVLKQQVAAVLSQVEENRLVH